MGTCSGKLSRQCLGLILRKLFRSKFSKLTSAIREGNLGLVKQYHSQNVNFNQILPNGETLLHIAAKYSSFEIVKFVANNVHALKFNDRSYLGDTPLLLAVMNHKYEKAGHKEHHDGSGKNNKANKSDKNEKNVTKKEGFPIIEYLVKVKTVNVNIAENRGFTPFLAACANGDPKLVQFLLDNGANYKVRSKDGQTGMHRAAFYGNEEIIIYLIKQLKMSTLTLDNTGNLPIHYACMKLNISCIRILIKASKLPASQLLHIENKHEVKPIDILLRVLNRVRIYNDPYTQFRRNEIEEYINNKQRLPPFHKNHDISSASPGSPSSPRSSRRSRRDSNARKETNAGRLSERRAIPLLKLGTAALNAPPGYDQLLQTLESESRLTTEDHRPMITEEEELIGSLKTIDGLSTTRRRGTSARISRGLPLPVIPSELSPRPKSPRQRHQHTLSLSPPVRDGRRNLKLDTKIFEVAKTRLSLRSHSISRMSISGSMEEPKSAHSFLGARGGKSRFAALQRNDSSFNDGNKKGGSQTSKNSSKQLET